MDEIEKNLEKLRSSPVNELTIKDIKLLSAYLTTQVKMDELTKRDKKFLGSYLKAQGVNERFTCIDCGDNYDMPPIQNIDLCIMCISKKGIHFPENPFDRGCNTVVNVIIYGCVIIFFLSLLQMQLRILL